jgi:two-component system alkaline phosphatase synthesis response regulator PhoP
MTAPPPILIAEDDATMAKLLSELLRPFGREIHRVHDGDTVLPMVKHYRPGLLLLDLNMPKRNGLEVLRSVRREPQLAGLRVLVITGQGQQETAEKAREAGADDFLRKPIDLDEARERVRALLPAVGVA